MKLQSFLYLNLQRAMGSRVNDYLAEFFRLEKVSQDELRKIESERLKQLLGHATANVPYFRGRVSDPSSIENFPILTKNEIREHFTDLMTKDTLLEYKGEKKRAHYSWIAVQTGGSTGVPTTVIHDPEYRDRGRAGRLYSRVLCGFPLGTPHYRLWGSMREINQSKDSLVHRLQSYLTDETILNAFQMEDGDIERYFQLMRHSSAEHMMAYVDAAYHMAQYAIRKNIRPKPLKSIMACAGTVTDDMRAALKEVFGARVHNQYGSRDCSGIACECEFGQHHIYSHNLLLEVVDDQGRKVPNGQSGRILVTLLGNRAFPLIRYEIGDVGALCSETCPCGRPFPILKCVEGRSVEFLTSTEGGYVSPVYIRHLIGVVHNPGVIRRFQLIQQTSTKFELMVELENGIGDSEYGTVKGNLERDLGKVLGTKSSLSISPVPSIAPSASGKFLYTINRCSMGAAG